MTGHPESNSNGVDFLTFESVALAFDVALHGCGAFDFLVRGSA